MTSGMSDWREDDDLESFEAQLERDKLSPEGLAETNRHLVERQALFRRATDVATAAVAPENSVRRRSPGFSKRIGRRLWYASISA